MLGFLFSLHEEVCHNRPVPAPVPRSNLQLYKPKPAPRRKKQRPVPMARIKTLKKMVEYFNANPIPPHPRQNVIQFRKTLSGYFQAFRINMKNVIDPAIQLQEPEVRRLLGDSLGEMNLEGALLRVKMSTRENTVIINRTSLQIEILSQKAFSWSEQRFHKRLKNKDNG